MIRRLVRFGLCVGLLVVVGNSLLAQPVVAPASAYAPAIEAIEQLIATEVADKRLPALSIALVDDQRIVWAKGFGFQDTRKTIPATAETVYRVGSVSKLFTDVAIMQLVEKGQIDLDAPASRYLPDFRPVGKAEFKPVTLRMLMSHRSGLIREPPVGNYFDPTEPTLTATVASLNGIDLVYPPGEKTKYSNAGIGAVGLAVETVLKKPFPEAVQAAVLDRLQMKSSAFVPTPAVKKHLADAVMWTYHGREFQAPTFELGMAPAGCLYASVLDLAKFSSCLFAGGKLPEGNLLKPESIAEMTSPQFVKPGEKEGFGLGFFVSEFSGRKRISHGGAVYGFATTWSALPDDKLSAIVVCSRDVANAVTTRIANESLRAMLGVKEGKPLPTIEKSEPLPADEARKLAGRYRSGDKWLDLRESFGKLHLTTHNGLSRLQLRKSGEDLIVDDVQGFGNRLKRKGDSITRGKDTYTRETAASGAPPEPPAKWKGLIGEYGWDHNTLYIYESDGQLHALIEWTEINPLTEESEDVYAFPADRGMYHGEKLVFKRDASGRASQVEAAKVVFQRRKVDGENGETFRIQPVKPVAELREQALKATPPAEDAASLRPSELVDLETIPGIKLDIRYATTNNFLGTPVYTSAKAYMQRPAADALKRVNQNLAAEGYGLLIYDAYRPWYVTRIFWDATEEKFHNFVADPSKGSRHNRGCAVDLTLYDLKTGKPVQMVSGYDEFSDRAFQEYPGGTSRQRWHRDRLRQAMEAEGFSVYEEEWWHFDYKDWRQYGIGNKRFEDLKPAR